MKNIFTKGAKGEMEKIILQACVKSEDDLTPMLRFYNYGNEPVMIDNLHIKYADKKINDFLANINKTLIIPGESFRFYFVDESFLNPPLDNFLAEFDVGDTHIKQSISFDFRKSMFAIKKGERKDIHAQSQEKEYQAIRLENMMNERFVLEEIRHFIYAVYVFIIDAYCEPQTADERKSIIDEFVVFCRNRMNAKVVRQG